MVSSAIEVILFDYSNAYILNLIGNWAMCGTINNTGIVSIMRSNNREPELSTKLTLSHELGHSFGAQVVYYLP